MHTFAQKRKPNQQTKSTGSATHTRASFAQNDAVGLILHLQRTIGNQAVQRLLQGNAEEMEESSTITASTRFGHDLSPMPPPAEAHSQLQPKLSVSNQGDPHQQGADRVFDQVMRRPEQQLKKEGAKAQQPMLQRQDASESETEQSAPTPSNAPSADEQAYAPEHEKMHADEQANEWNPWIPYIVFDIWDTFAERIYTSSIGGDRNDNVNFTSNLNPGPVRDLNMRRPGSRWRVMPWDLRWHFHTKFRVDTPSAPLPKNCRATLAKADIKFETDSGKTAFEDHFLDNAPKYTPPFIPEFRYYLPTDTGVSIDLRTDPFWFRSTQTINESGTLLWDAELQIDCKGGGGVNFKTRQKVRFEPMEPTP